MKNSIQLNIGLSTNDGQTLTIPEIATSLRHAGLVLVAARIATGVWEGREEQTLACEVLPALPVCHAECRLAIAQGVAKLARELRQTCIALAWSEGHGELCPPVSGQSFDPLLFFHLAEEPAPRTHDRRFFECITHDLYSIREHAEEIGNAQACIVKEIDSLLEIIRPRAITHARIPEVTSGW